MDSEDGSVAMIAWVPITIMFALFVFIALSKVFDILVSFQAKFALANPSIPVSPDRVMYTQWFIWGWQSLLLFAVVLPVLYYAILVARRRNDSNI
jgi:hypothetical protein